MLAILRRSLNTLPVRLFFLALVAAFIFWGVAGQINLSGSEPPVARVAGQKIMAQQVQPLYQQQLQRLEMSMPSGEQPTPAIRQALAASVVNQLITTAAIDAAMSRMGITVPEKAMQETIWAIPAFHGPSGQFDPATFQSVLQRNNLTQEQFLGMMRGQITRTQFFGALRAGIVSPNVLTQLVYRYRGEARTADAVTIADDTMPAPPDPTERQVQRWYANHPDDYRAPEYRRIRAVVLSPQTLASDIKVSEADIEAAFKSEAPDLAQSEKLDIEIVTATDAAKAKAIADAWSSGADWTAIQALAKADDATALALTNAARGAFPSEALADAAFKAKEGVVTGPIAGEAGNVVFRVTKITAAVVPTLATMHDQIRQQIIKRRAGDIMDTKAGKVDDLLAGGAALASLPGDLGLGAVEGTLDAQGMTEEGKPAPIPGDAALRQALVAEAFRATPSDLPRLIEAPQAQDGTSNGYYALEVEKIIPAAEKPYATVAKQVAADWHEDQLRHAAETVAAKLMMAVNNGATLSDAAAADHLTVTRLPAVTRTGATGFPPTLLDPLFATKEGQATMAASPGGFIVAQLVAVHDPDAAKDALDVAKLRDEIAGTIDTDLEDLATAALRERGKPVINKTQLASIVGSGQ